MRQVDQITGQTNTMGIAEQLADIRVWEEKESVIKKLLMGAKLSLGEIAAVVGVSESFVEKIKEAVQGK